MSSSSSPVSAAAEVQFHCSDSAASAAMSPATPTHTSPPAAAAATHPPATVAIAPATSAFSAATADPRRDLTDLPADVLPLLFSCLPPGSRLDPRVVCRAWSSWVDHSLAASTHLNLVLDAPELRRVLRRRQQQLRQQHLDGSGGGGGDGGSKFEPPAGLFAAKFPTATSVRLWVGCRPSAALAGRNGGGGAAAAAAAATAMMRRNAASDAAAAAAAFVVSSAERLQEGLADGAAAFVAVCLQAMVPRVPPWPVVWRLRRQERRRRFEEVPRLPRWHVHKSDDPGDAPVALLRRYAADPPDARLEPLSSCLPLLGPSSSLMRLSVVTAHNLTQQDLLALREAFPRLAALAIHSHKDSTLDFKPADLPTLELFFPQTAAAAAEAALPAASSNPGGSSSSSENNVAIATAEAGGGSGGVGPPPVAALAEQRPLRQQLQLRSLLLSGLRLDWPDVGGGGGLAAFTQLHALVLHRTCGRMHRLLPQIKALTQLTRLELRGLDYHHSLPLDDADQSLIDSKMLFLEHLQLQRHRRAAAAAAGQAAPPPPPPPAGGGGSAAVAAAATAAPGGGGEVMRRSPPGPRSDGSADEDEWEEACRPPGGGGGGDGGGGKACHAPWMWALPGCGAKSMARCARPDWHATLRALGRAVRQMDELKVLVCDVECPPAPRLAAALGGGGATEATGPAAETFPPALGPDLIPARKRRGAWDLLLAGVCRLRNLQELRLPYLVLHDDAQVAALAAALPALTTLELSSLPPPPQQQRQRWHSREQERSATDAMWQRYVPLEPGGGGGDGSGGGGEGFDGGCAAIQTHKTKFEIDVELEAEAEAGPGLAGFRQLRELVLHRGSVRQLSYWLPLPPRLQRLEAPIQGGDQRQSALNGVVEAVKDAISVRDLPLMQSRLLPALSTVPHLTLKLLRVSTHIQCRTGLPGAAAASETTTTTTTTTTNTNIGRTCRCRCHTTNNTNTNITTTAAATEATTTTTPIHAPGTRAAVAGEVGAVAAVRLPAVLAAAVKAGEVLAVAMLAAWLPGSLTRLDLSAVTAPGLVLGEEEAFACLYIAAEGLPQLRLLSCCLWAGGGTSGAGRRSSGGSGGGGSRGPMDPESHQDQTSGEGGGRGGGSAARPWAGGGDGIGGDGDGDGDGGGRGGGGGGGEGDPASPPEQQQQQQQERRRLHGTAVDCFNAMPRLEELRVKVFAPAARRASGSVSYHAVRVPMGFLRSLRRPVRVVDCSPLDAWCSLDGATHPREALCRARAVLAAGGCRATLLSESEEFAAAAMGLAPEMEDKWRGPLEVL
ncbi:hypothetical protein PLESTM_000447100 [Pleodorina starrii]|nr:hypothetical protein PLESTM_000447100 [Pleodorina starrii]